MDANFARCFFPGQYHFRRHGCVKSRLRSILVGIPITLALVATESIQVSYFNDCAILSMVPFQQDKCVVCEAFPLSFAAPSRRISMANHMNLGVERVIFFLLAFEVADQISAVCYSERSIGSKTGLAFNPKDEARRRLTPSVC